MSYLSEFFIPKEFPIHQANKVRQETIENDIPVNVELICEMKDYEIIYEDLEDGIYGKSYFISNEPKIVISNKIKERIYFKRWTISHEIGHLEFQKKHFNDLYLNASKDFKNPNKKYISNSFETEADTFAKELLMPCKEFKKDTIKLQNLDGWKSIDILKNKYQVSLFATCIRFIEFTPLIAIFLVFNKNGNLYSLHYSDEFKSNKFYIDRNTTLPNSSFAKHIMINNEIKGKRGELDCITWFPSKKFNKRQKLFEHSFIAKDKIYVLLWFEAFYENDIFLI